VNEVRSLLADGGFELRLHGLPVQETVNLEVRKCVRIKLGKPYRCTNRIHNELNYYKAVQSRSPPYMVRGWLICLFLDIYESCLTWSPQIRRRGRELTLA
jgi:hypothetical protein